MIDILLTSKNTFKRGVFDENYYTKTDELKKVLEYVLIKTAFLNDYTGVTIRHRLYHLKFNKIVPEVCKYCNELKKLSDIKGFIYTCDSKKCKRKYRSELTKELYQNAPIEFKKHKSEITSKVLKSLKPEVKRARYLKAVRTRKNNGRPWITPEQKDRQRNAIKRAVNTPEYKEKFNATKYIRAQKVSDTLKQKILSGTFTPNITNSWTRWKSYVNIDGEMKKFRSDWEAIFYLYNPELKFESIRIPYRVDDSDHVYIVDFCDDKNKILYEIKPKSKSNDAIFKLKQIAAENWCIQNNFKYEIIDETWFQLNDRLINFKNNEHLLSKRTYRRSSH